MSFERISRERLFMEKTVLVSQRSTCLRSQVGIIFVRDKREIASGYCGAPTNLPHCTPEICNENQSCLNTVHAEANAIAWAAREGISLKGCDAFCTLSPCINCAKLLINVGIESLFFRDQYRDEAGLQLLRDADILALPWSQVKDGHHFYG